MGSTRSIMLCNEPANESPAASKKSSSVYVAFLRGINVGGHASIQMAELRAAFKNMGFLEVRTVLASGNVVFESEHSDKKAIADKITSGLKRVLKKDIGVVLRSLDDLAKLCATEPFKGIRVTPDIRLYVTFLPERAKAPAMALPYSTPRGELRILRASAAEVLSVVDLSKGKGTSEAMAILEKEFGAGVTTRNWNTFLKVLGRG
jgi:uncharacterized protein (DUF1697 family)